jgi:polysaccharide export outer membrane protein
LAAGAWAQGAPPEPKLSDPAVETASASQKLPPTSQELQEVHIAPGDLLQIRAFGVPDLTQEIRVNAHGDISMPLLDTVHVEGLTTDGAAKLLQDRLGEGFLRDPQISVFIKEYTTQGVSVLGEVQRPGIYTLLGERRLYDAVSAAGGTTSRAGRDIAVTHRNEPDKPILIANALSPDSGTNAEILPGDTIVVLKAQLVYVVGDVGHPNGLVMENNRMTVLQAIAMAGGANGTAALSSTRILRRTPQGVEDIPVPLKKILSAQARDIDLQPEDVVYVPNSKSKGAARRSVDAILSIATGIAIYRP